MAAVLRAAAARFCSLLPALLAALVLLVPAIQPAQARDEAYPSVPVAQLPREARETMALIRAGGPFPYRQDNTVFGNREKRLPMAARGHYREYTVKTPGSRDRGARRIVAAASGELYYTDDHYNSFRRIKE